MLMQTRGSHEHVYLHHLPGKENVIAYRSILPGHERDSNSKL